MLRRVLLPWKYSQMLVMADGHRVRVWSTLWATDYHAIWATGCRTIWDIDYRTRSLAIIMIMGLVVVRNAR